MAGAQITTASFASPMALIAPDLAVQQQQVARQQQLAQQLREMSFEDSTAPGGGRVSWTQGLARLMDAVASKSIQAKADTQQMGLSRSYASALRGRFGMPGQTPPPLAGGAGGGASPMPQPMPTGDDRGTYGSGGVDDDGTLSPSSPAVAPAPAGAPAAAMASTPSPASPQAMAPQQPAPQPMPPQASAQGPMSLTGDPNQDAMMYSLNPDEYTKALISARAPVDMAKTIAQARQAMASGDMATASALLASVDKQNYIAPINGRPGSTIRDPHDPSRILASDPQNIEGANPVLDANGRWTGAYQSAPGAADAAATMAAAKARGGAAGDLVQTFNPATGQMEYTPKSAVLGGGAGGSLDTMFGGAKAGGNGTAAPGPARPFAAGPAQGSGAAADAMGKASGQGFANLAEAAADGPNRIYALRQMQGIANGPTVLGPGSDAAQKFAGVMNSFGQAIGMPTNFNGQTITSMAEFNKWSSQYSARAAQDLGLGGSDARMNLTVQATPNGHMTNAALQSVIPQMIGFENAKQGMANAGAQYAAKNGAQSYPQFLQAWRANYDPRIYTAMAQGPAAVKGLLKGLPANERQALIAKSNVLASIGALPQ